MTHESQHHDALTEHAQQAPAAGGEPGHDQAERAPSPGQTAGLPGSNADPRTLRVGDDETAPTTLMGEVAPE